MATWASARSSGTAVAEAPLPAPLLADTQAELVRTAAAAAMWQARAELLGAQVERLQRALEAPREPQTAPDTRGGPTASLTVETAPGAGSDVAPALGGASGEQQRRSTG
jgi:hypothetical protein